ncbi:MAG: efflux RND transporter permease subunit [Pseudomonadota bacterium]
MKWRDSLEKRFEDLGRLVYRRRFLFLAGVLLFAGALISQLPKTTVDTSPISMLHANDPAMADYNAFRDQFGREEVVILALGPADVFSREFLLRLKALHEDLEDNVPHLDEVTSLMNARDTRGEGDALVVEDLLANWPEEPRKLDQVRRRAMENPLYQNLLLSADGQVTTVVVKTRTYSSRGTADPLTAFEEPAAAGTTERPIYITDEENSELVLAVREAIKRHEAPGLTIRLAGTPVLTHVLKTWMLHDMGRFLALAVLSIAVFLFIIFRSFTAVILPLFTVILALFSTLGLMAATGTPLKMPTQILPTFLLAVGVADSVHILAIFFRRMGAGESREDALAHALGHSGLAVVLTSLTTAGGLLSFASAEIAPIADLGIFASAGVILALVYTLLFLPAALAIIPVRARVRSRESAENSIFSRFLTSVGDFATGHPWKIVAVAALLTVVAGLGATRLHFSHAPITWLPEDSEPRLAAEFVDEKMRGSVTMELVVDTGRENGLHDPALLSEMASLGQWAEGYSQGNLFVGHTQSLADVIREINQALHENRPEFYRVPGDRALVAQEFLLFENSGSDDLEDVVDSLFSKARFSIKTPSLDAVEYVGFANEMEKRFQDSLGDKAEITTTGFLTLLFRTLYAVMHTMVKSYITAFVIITFLMILLIGSVRVGMAAMVPNILPILVCLGFMGWMGVSLDTFTILVGSIAIGLAVDDTIHFMHNFRRYFQIRGDARLAIHDTLQTTGRALFFTSAILCFGFYIMVLSTMKNVAVYGALTGSAIALALVADFLVAPALVTLLYAKKTPARGKTGR